MQGFLFAFSERNLNSIFSAVLANRPVTTELFAPRWGVGFIGELPTYSWQHNELSVSAPESGLFLGLGIGEYFVASHRQLLKPVVNTMVHVPAGCTLVVRENNYEVRNGSSEVVALSVQPVVEPKREAALPEGFRSYFEADIYAQADFLEQYFTPGSAAELAELVGQLKAASHVYIVGSGSGYHAALIAQQWFEFALQISCSVDLASEFVARSPYLQQNAVVLLLDCGDNADNIGAVLAYAEQKPNVTTRVLRRADYFDVPTTPVAFSYELALLFNVALLGLTESKRHYREALPQIADDVRGILRHHEQISALIAQLGVYKEVFVLGRGVHFGLAKELEYRLRQVCAVHAMAIPTGEFKHGNIALVNSKRPIILINPSAQELTSTVTAVRRVAGTQLPIIVLASSLLNVPHDVAASVYQLPVSSAVTEAFVYSVAIQLLVLELAQLHGRALDVTE